MAVTITEIKDNMRLAWLSLLEALYTFSPWQRLVLVCGLFLVFFGFFIFKFGSRIAYNYSYKKYELVTKSAFRDPVASTVDTTTILPLLDDRYIAYAKIANNNLYLSGSGTYRAVFRASNGRQVYETTGSFYLLPGLATFVVVPSFRAVETPVTGEISIQDATWQKKFVLPDVRLSTPAPIKFAEGSGMRLEGLVINNSPYRLGRVRVVVFVYNQSSQVIGVSDYSVLSVNPSERRAYVVHFPTVSPNAVYRVVPMAETNTADVGNIQTLDNKLPVQDQE